MRQTAQALLHFGGVNLNRDARVLRPDQLALSKNAFPVIPGILGKRYGVAAQQIAILGTSNQYLPLSWGIPSPQTGFKYVAHMHKMDATPRQYLIASSFDNESSTISNGVRKDVGDSQSDYEPVKFVNYRGRCIALLPGTEGYWVLEPKPAGGYEWIKNTFAPDPTVFTEGGTPVTQMTPVAPRNAAQYKQRMVWGNFGPGMGNWICFADKFTSYTMQPLLGYSLMARIGTDVLSLNGRHVEVGALEGEEIVAMQEVTLGAVGSALESVLMLLTAESCAFISGEILQTNESAPAATDPKGLFGSYAEHRVNYKCGCVGQQTLVKTPYGWVWAGPDDVWLLSGNTPIRIGTNIRPALLACPVNSRKYWSAAYADGVYVLQLVTANAQRSDGASGDLTSYLHEYWYLDLRNGVPDRAESAQWYGPMQVLNENGSTIQYGPLLSNVDSDGEQVLGLALNTDGRNLSIVNFLSNSDALDTIQPGVVSGLEWTASTQYGVKDTVRVPMTQANAGATGRLHTCITQALLTSGSSLTIGNFYYGVSSLARGKVRAKSGNTVMLTDITGAPFIVGEAIHDDTTGLPTGLTVAAELTNGTSGTLPSWSTSNGGETIDGTILWQEITGSDVAALGIQLLQRQNAEYQADVRYRDNLLNDTSHEKLVRRVDVNVAAQSQVNLSATALLDQGNAPKSLGTISFGGESLQGDVDEIGGIIGGLKSRAKTFRPVETNLVQCRSAQIKINDETSFVIDDTNNRFLVGFSTGADPPTNYVQVSIANGNYADINAIFTAIVSALNAVAGSVWTAAGLTAGANPWTHNTQYGVTHPYFSRIRMTVSSIGAIAFGKIITDDQDATVAAGTILNDLTGTTAYLSRCKKLSALLGFYTQATYSYPASNIFLFDGTEIVHNKNSKRFDISSANVVVQPKTAVPFKAKNRS